MSINENVRRIAVEMLAADHADPGDQLNRVLRLLSKRRSDFVRNEYLHTFGTIVMGGPFAGLDFVEQSAEGCHAPKLFGCYEQPLHAHIEAAIARGYSDIVNIGCAEGYYVVGMARRMPNAWVHAYDIDPIARQGCVDLAKRNGVEQRVTIGELFTHSDFARFAGSKSLVLCDIEGAEHDLLDPVRAPALRQLDVIVEAHVGLRATMVKDLAARFVDTHDIVVVQDDGMRQLPQQPAWFRQMGHLDQLLATWEWRTAPTPWLVMTVREPRSANA